MRRAAKVDANQSAIVRALERCGCLVYSIGRPFDLLVQCRGELTLLEVKVPKGSRVTPLQKRDRERGWIVHFVRTEEEALRAVGLIAGFGDD